MIGPNGAGKTTTFYMMVGLIEPEAGRVVLGDREITSLPMFRRARMGVAYLAQEPSAFKHLSTEDNIWLILEALGYSQGQILGLKQSRAVVPTNWYKWAEDGADAQPLKLFYSDELSKDGLE